MVQVFCIFNFENFKIIDSIHSTTYIRDSFSIVFEIPSCREGLWTHSGQAALTEKFIYRRKVGSIELRLGLRKKVPLPPDRMYRSIVRSLLFH